MILDMKYMWNFFFKFQYNMKYIAKHDRRKDVILIIIVIWYWSTQLGLNMSDDMATCTHDFLFFLIIGCHFFKYCLIEAWRWISNYIYCFMWDVITHPCLSFNNGLTKSHGWVITSQTQTDSDSDSDKVYSTKIYTSTISGLHEFLRNTNNNIVLIYK